MRWRNSVLFPIVLFPFAAACVLSGLLVFSVLLLPARPLLLWSGVVLLGLAAPVGAFFFGLRLQRRLQRLYDFVAIAPQRDFPLSLPVWNDDEVGDLETGFQRLVSQHHERLRTLQSESKKLAAVLQSMAEGVVVIDPAGNVVLCNRAAQDLFDLSHAHEWHGKPLQAFSRHPVLQELLREVASRRPSDEPVAREFESEGRTPRHLSVSAMQVSEDGATISGYVLVFHDLTQLKRLESVRSDFVANVSHELRTPLTAIKGYAETLLNGALNNPEIAQRFLTIIDRHSERLSRLIDDLLTLSHLELGTAELGREEIVCADLVDEVFEIVKDKAARGEVTLTRECSADLPPLVGDGDRLHQVLINLIDNAIKYTPAGGTVTVTAKLVRSAECGVPSRENFNNEEECMEVAVADTGCGIPEVEIPRLTQRFYRVDKARSRELGGTGLGLAIVKHIVQAHGGSLRIESQVNQGTTVRLLLPLTVSN